MIKSVRDADAKRLGNEERTRRIPARLRKPALQKLHMLNTAAALTDFLVPPENRLEALRRDRLSQHSVRINDQCRICFQWRDSNPYNAEITVFH